LKAVVLQESALMQVSAALKIAKIQGAKWFYQALEISLVPMIVWDILAKSVTACESWKRVLF